MRTDEVVENEIVDKALLKKPKVLYRIKVLSDELFLDGSVIALHSVVHLGAMRVAEPMFDLYSTEVCIEAAEELRTVIAPTGSDLTDQNETFHEILRCAACRTAVAGGQSKRGSNIDSRDGCLNFSKMQLI